MRLTPTSLPSTPSSELKGEQWVYLAMGKVERDEERGGKREGGYTRREEIGRDTKGRGGEES